MTRCKITVLKTTLMEDLAAEYVSDPEYGPCPVLQEGQTFLTGGIFGNEMPEGFCAQAWQGLVMPVNVLIGGGKVLGFDEKHITCCNDGLRPVIFRVERYKEAEEGKAEDGKTEEAKAVEAKAEESETEEGSEL